MKIDNDQYIKMAMQCGLIEDNDVYPSPAEYIADILKFAEIVAKHENYRCFRIVSKEIPEYKDDPHAYHLLSLIAYKVGTV